MTTFDLNTEVERQRRLGYETFNDYLERTGFQRDADSYAAFLAENRWLITSSPDTYGS